MITDYLALVAATWPAAETRAAGGFLLRRGAGGGNRTSAATLTAAGGYDIAEAEAGMRAWGQRPLFLLRPEDLANEAALDADLAGRGYGIHDPSILFAAPAAALAPETPDRQAIPCDGPLAIMARLWDAGGIGPDRRAVMDRVRARRTWLLGRNGEEVAGCAFAGALGATAMLHALQVAPDFRRRGIGGRLTSGAAAWALSVGARSLALAVTERNHAARRLYSGLGMTEAGRYHYRLAPEQDPAPGDPKR